MRPVAAAAAWVLLMGAGAAAQAPASKLDTARLEQFIRHLFLWGPQIQVKLSQPVPSPIPGLLELRVTGSFQQASQEELFYVTADGSHLMRGSLFRTDRPPYADEHARLRTEGQPSIGPAGAPLQLVVFSDFQCSFCREEARSLRENLPKAFAGQFRLVFRDLPLEQIHPWAKTAAVAGRCAFRQSNELFWKYHDWIFANQPEIKPDNFRAKVTEWAKTAGADEASFLSCLDSPQPAAEVAAGLAEARALRIQSTPTLFVNGRALTGNVPWPQLKAILDLELEFAKKADASCCTLTLPVPGK
ncbi:MAG: thioredoxin domain-containing protein [Bryobacteraceae bacterium]